MTKFPAVFTPGKLVNNRLSYRVTLQSLLKKLPCSSPGSQPPAQIVHLASAD